jgi:hypothetical protein
LLKELNYIDIGNYFPKHPLLLPSKSPNLRLFFLKNKKAQAQGYLKWENAGKTVFQKKKKSQFGQTN